MPKQIAERRLISGEGLEIFGVEFLFMYAGFQEDSNNHYLATIDHKFQTSRYVPEDGQYVPSEIVQEMIDFAQREKT